MLSCWLWNIDFWETFENYDVMVVEWQVIVGLMQMLWLAYEGTIMLSCWLWNIDFWETFENYDVMVVEWQVIVGLMQMLWLAYEGTIMLPCCLLWAPSHREAHTSSPNSDKNHNSEFLLKYCEQHNFWNTAFFHELQGCLWQEFLGQCHYAKELLMTFEDTHI